MENSSTMIPESSIALRERVQDRLAARAKVKAARAEVLASIGVAAGTLDAAKAARAKAEADTEVDAALGASDGDGRSHLPRLKSIEEKARTELERLQRLATGLLAKRRESDAEMSALAEEINRELTTAIYGPVLAEAVTEIRELARQLLSPLARAHTIISESGSALFSEFNKLCIPGFISNAQILCSLGVVNADGTVSSIAKLAAGDPDLRAVSTIIAELRALGQRCKFAPETARREDMAEVSAAARPGSAAA